MSGADEQPLSVRLVQTPQEELPETAGLLDLAEHVAQFAAAFYIWLIGPGLYSGLSKLAE